MLGMFSSGCCLFWCMSALLTVIISVITCASADGLLHESCIQKFPVHTEMEKIWPTEEDVPDFK